jgi:hypothetical protein
MRIRLEGSIPLPPDAELNLDHEVVWTYRPQEHRWEVKLAWCTLMFTHDEFGAFLAAGMRHWQREDRVRQDVVLEAYAANPMGTLARAFLNDMGLGHLND